MKELTCFFLFCTRGPAGSVAGQLHALRRRKAKISFSRSTIYADTIRTRIPGGRDGPGHLVSG